MKGDEYEPPLRLSLAVKQLKENAVEEMAPLAKIAANVCMFTPRMAATPSTTPTTNGGYGVDHNAALVNALAPRLNKDEKDTARYAEAKIWLKAQRAREHDASLRPSKKAVTLFPKYEDGEIPVELPSYAEMVEAVGMIPTAKDRESALPSAKIALFAHGYAYAVPIPKNVTEYSTYEAYVTGNKDGSAEVVAEMACLSSAYLEDAVEMWRWPSPVSLHTAKGARGAFLDGYAAGGGHAQVRHHHVLAQARSS
eukprot:4373970-Pleurochrysis_carterae.AAC.1